jgi:hypothetical protein
MNTGEVMKKAFIMGLMLTLSVPAFSMEQTVVKSCETVLEMPGENLKVLTKVDIIEEAGSLSATVTQTSNGQSSSYSDQVAITEEKVRAGITGLELSSDGSIEDLNLAEKLISHAISLTETPEMGGVMSAGFDLRAVRSAKVYAIGEATGMGVAAIVEAKNAKGEALGSFFGGFLVTPCKQK